mgnify:CR=1 FL=1
MNARAHRWIASIAFAALLVLHVDAWRAQRVVVYFGWVPEELLYRLAWMLLAWAFILYVCEVHWRTDEA